MHTMVILKYHHLIASSLHVTGNKIIFKVSFCRRLVSETDLVMISISVCMGIFKCLCYDLASTYSYLANYKYVVVLLI